MTDQTDKTDAEDSGDEAVSKKDAPAKKETSKKDAPAKKETSKKDAPAKKPKGAASRKSITKEEIERLGLDPGPYGKLKG